MTGPPNVPGQGRDRLAGLDEAAFRLKVLVPLLGAMGYRDVDHTHGPDELGKDLVAWREDDDGTREVIAVVAKVGDLNASASRDAMTVATQIRQAFGSDTLSVTGAETLRPTKVVVATTGAVSQRARKHVKVQIDSALQPHLRFWSGRKVCELLDSFLPLPTAPDYLAAFHRQASTLEHFDISATVDALGVRYAIAARQDGTPFARGVLSFPGTPEGDAVMAALDRYIEADEPVTIPASFVDSFSLHPELEGLFGPGGPVDLVLGGSVPDPHATVSVEVDGPLGPLRVRGLSVVSARMGTRRGELRTDPEAHPFALSLQIERVEGGVEITTGVQIDPAGHRVGDALQALRVWDAVGSGSPIRLILDATGDTLVELDASAHAHELHTLAPYLEDLAALEGYLGEIEVPKTLTQTDLQNAALLRSILTTGVGVRPFDGLTLTYAPGDEDTDALLRILSDEPHWMREIRPAPRFELVGRDFALGPAHALFEVRLDPVEADRVRARLAAGDGQASIRFDAAGDCQRTTVYRDHLPEPLRSRYEELRERMPPLLDWSPGALPAGGTP